MPLVTRQGKGGKLTIAEMDANLEYLEERGRPYKIYSAILSQTKTDAPVAIVLENTLGGTLVWGYANTGTYVGTLTGAFTLGKTSVMISGVYKGSVVGTRKNNNEVYIATTATRTDAENDDLLDNTAIEIKVYD